MPVLPGDIVDARYRIEREFAETRYGKTYIARDVATSAASVVRFLSAGQLRSDRVAVAEEAWSAWSRMRELTVHSFEHAVLGKDGGLVLASKHVEGVPLFEFANQNRSDWRALADVLLSAFDAVARHHSAGFAHGNLKSENILVASTGQVTVMDGMLSHVRVDDALDESFRLRSPETMTDPSRADFRSDVFSLGVVAYQTLGGHPAFSQSQKEAAIDAIRSARTSPLRAFAPDVPAELAEVIQRSMRARAGERFQSVEEFAQAFATTAGLPHRAVERNPNPAEASRVGQTSKPATSESESAPASPVPIPSSPPHSTEEDALHDRRAIFFGVALAAAALAVLTLWALL